MAEVVIEVPEQVAEALDGFEFVDGPELVRAALAESAGRAYTLAGGLNGKGAKDATELLAAGERIVALSHVYEDVAAS
jgi:hypothetical protein